MQSNISVLVVEDEPSMQILLEHTLRRAGFEVTLARNGTEGKSVLSRGHFDLICSDVMMSGLDGVQLCRWAKQTPHIRKIPFVLISSRAQVGDREAGMEAGADQYLTKPFDVQELVTILQRLLTEHR